MANEKKLVIEVSPKSVIVGLLLVFGFWLIYEIKEVLFGLFIALILAGALNPTVTRLEKRGVPRTLAALIMYLILIIVLVGSLALVIPAVVSQTTDLVKTFPSIAQSLRLDFLGSDFLTNQLGQIGNLSSRILSFTFGFFSSFITVMAILVISFYFLLEHENLDQYLLDFFGKEIQIKGQGLVRRLEKILGNWVRAQLLLMLFVGVLSYIGYSLLGLKFALPLSVFMGILEVVPGMGPFIGAIPAVLIGLFISPLTALAVAAWAFIVQQIENNYLVPRIMSRVVGINPVTSLISIVIGANLAGVAGALLAIPTYLTARLLFQEFILKKN
ncbi:MAG: AI-2E family transporter [Candidatus Shapirobacteria bacterium]